MSEGRAMQGQGATSVERESVKVVLNGNTGVAIFPNTNVLTVTITRSIAYIGVITTYCSALFERGSLSFAEGLCWKVMAGSP